MTVNVDVGIEAQDTESVADTLRLIAAQIEEDYREGFDRAFDRSYHYTVTWEE